MAGDFSLPKNFNECGNSADESLYCLLGARVLTVGLMWTNTYVPLKSRELQSNYGLEPVKFKVVRIFVNPLEDVLEQIEMLVCNCNVIMTHESPMFYVFFFR